MSFPTDSEDAVFQLVPLAISSQSRELTAQLAWLASPWGFLYKGRTMLIPEESIVPKGRDADR